MQTPGGAPRALIVVSVTADHLDLTGPLRHELDCRGFDIVVHTEEPSVLPDGPWLNVVCIWGDDQSLWPRVPDQAVVPCVGSVVVSDQYDVATYLRAYRAGAALARLEFPPAYAADVIVARTRGELLVPASLLPSLLDHLRNGPPRLGAAERLVLGHLAKGMTLAEVARETVYSERHVRRIAQSIFAKAGTNDRRRAVEVLLGQPS